MAISIHPIKNSITTLYAIRGEGVILIDGGPISNIKNFKRELETASIEPGDIQLIILTHGHFDHIGSVKEMQELTGAKVLLHQEDMPLLVETNPPLPAGISSWGKIANILMRLVVPFIHTSLFEVDIVAGDEDYSLAEFGIPGKIVHTPGHTPGSISVLMEGGEAFVGDLAMSMFPMRLTPGLPIFGYDMDVVINSWRKVLGYGLETIYPGHGKPFPASVMEKIVVNKRT